LTKFSLSQRTNAVWIGFCRLGVKLVLMSANSSKTTPLQDLANPKVFESATLLGIIFADFASPLHRRA
jgi:hypothetical protein